MRAATLCLVNRERSRHGERPLQRNLDLVHAAQAHTESMASATTSNTSARAVTPRRCGCAAPATSSALGTSASKSRENIGWGSLWLGTPRSIVSTWMHSAGHRANILDRHFRDTGIGVSPHTNGLAHGQRGGIYTQDFGVIVS